MERAPIAETRSTCCYCGVGCGVIIQHHGGKIVGVRGDPDHPANYGKLCSKGATLHETTTLAGRALHPELRLQRTSSRQRVGWDDALEHAAARFAAIIRAHGPDAVAFYISGQLLTEDYYVFNKLAKGLIGTNNVDSNSRLCMSSAVAGYKQTLGMDAPPACYDDIDHADCMLIWGANPAYAHPILHRRIEAAKSRKPELRIIVVDPRKTDTAASADLHLAVVPGTDLVLLNAILHVLIWEDRIDRDFVRAHTEGFDELRSVVSEMTPALASQLCGVPADDIVTAARWFGEAGAALSMWCQGLNQSTHGTLNTAAIVHLHLATGQIGRPGAGPLSLTGQPNAMGGREVGGMANLLTAHRDLGSATDRAWVANFWGVDAVPERPGRTAVELFDALESGDVKAVWIACTNPAQSLPHLDRVQSALARAEFVVLQDAFSTTETAPFADLLLPAASWGEKDGTVTNSERCITRVRRAVEPPAEARADWRIACDFALALGRCLEKDAATLFPYLTPETIFLEHAQSTRGRDLDIAELDYTVLDRDGPQQWPYRDGKGTARLYTDGRFPTASGRARFVKIDTRTTAENIDARYPLRMTTGRLRDQWHGMSRTGRTARAFGHVPEPMLTMHPDDMERRDLRPGAYARIRSRRGSIVLRVEASFDMQRGHVFVPMHFGASHLSHAGVNVLCLSAFDPYSKQPELKHAAVQVELCVLPWEVVALRRASPEIEGDEQALRWIQALRPLLRNFDYAYVSLTGRRQCAATLRVAHREPLSESQTAEIDLALDLASERCSLYEDRRRGISKRAWVEGDRLLGFRLTGEVSASNWLADTLTEDRSASTLRRWMLGPFSAPPLATALPAAGRIVCNCHGVAETPILECIGRGGDMDALQKELRCGTNCGSCLPELRRMLVQTAPTI